MKFDRSNKFDFCYYGQVKSLRLKSTAASKWANKHLWGYYLFCWRWYSLTKHRLTDKNFLSKTDSYNFFFFLSYSDHILCAEMHKKCKVKWKCTAMQDLVRWRRSKRIPYFADSQIRTGFGCPWIVLSRAIKLGPFGRLVRWFVGRDTRKHDRPLKIRPFTKRKNGVILT